MMSEKKIKTKKDETVADEKNQEVTAKENDVIFESNPTLDLVYKTSDGQYFYTENSAQNHAKNLKENKVEKLENLNK